MSNLLRRAKALLLACALGFAPCTWAATTVSTMADWDGSSSICCFGIPDTATYGQVITVPAGETTLSSFTFQMQLPTTVVIRGEVFAWDAATSRATGASLYESPVTSTTQGAAFEAVTFTIPAGIPVIPGQQYVIFASTSKDQAGASGSGVWGGLASDAYAGGAFVYQNNSNVSSQWTTVDWDQWSVDLAFTAIFGQAASPVPTAVPTLSEWSLALMALVLGGVAALTVRRRS